MKIKMRIAIFPLLFMVFTCLDAFSQKVQKKVSTGEVFIDCTSMPWAVEKTLNGIGDSYNFVYKRLQIATKDCGSKGYEGETIMNWAVAVGLSESYNEKNATGQIQGQVKATGCAAYWEKNKDEAGSWRVPTQRELLLIQILLDGNSTGTSSVNGPLAKALGTAALFTSNYYWSSGNSEATLGWSVSFGNAGNGNATELKNGIRAVRCVREVR